MTPDQQAAFEGTGYLVLEDALSESDLACLRTEFDHADSQSRLDDLPNSDDSFIRLAEHHVSFPLLHRIIGDNIQLRALRGEKSEPGEAGRGWHREVAGILGVNHAASTVLTQAFYILDDAADTGALWVVPGSHRFKEGLDLPQVAEIRDMPHSTAIPVRARTAVLLHGNIWQAVSQNGGSSAIRWLRYDYFHCWMRQALPELSAHAEEAASATHNLSQLFGTVIPHTAAKGYWGREIEGYPSSGGLPERRFSRLDLVGRETLLNSELGAFQKLNAATTSGDRDDT